MPESSAILRASFAPADQGPLVPCIITVMRKRSLYSLSRSAVFRGPTLLASHAQSARWKEAVSGISLWLTLLSRKSITLKTSDSNAYSGCMAVIPAAISYYAAKSTNCQPFIDAQILPGTQCSAYSPAQLVDGARGLLRRNPCSLHGPGPPACLHAHEPTHSPTNECCGVVPSLLLRCYYVGCCLPCFDYTRTS